ncbi:hypothetical protein MY04_2569 [Flammeovirga sp. MY04]|uniref:hypothetical protein n=1 Tax=Flammeovirga sp. MY04 TaxID=1191459 RepID=UPI0008060F48|nr:hypothetical protein [Flammeovirga sp. MY04]ANQ49938.1 hypothetical protein MY04_2569 [Flammeovirga sp. MY04]
MSYSIEELQDIIVESCHELLEEQPLLFLREVDIGERAVSNGLSVKIDSRIEGYHVNCEYNRMTNEQGNQDPKRIIIDPDNPDPSLVSPDIIIHEQENGDNNLLVIEIKMSWKNGARERDFEKIIGYINDLNYQYGLYLELGEGGITDMRWFL